MVRASGMPVLLIAMLERDDRSREEMHNERSHNFQTAAMRNQASLHGLHRSPAIYGPYATCLETDAIGLIKR